MPSIMIDTHAHPLLCSQSDSLWFDRAKQAGVTHIVGVATSIKMGRDTLALSQKFPHLIPTIGIHPCEAHRPTDLDQLQSLITQYPQFKAIGEIGLDLYRNETPLDQQISVFKAQLEVARTVDLPVIIHTRQADKPMLDVLADYTDITRVFHCFDSPLEMAKAADTPLTFFSFTGMVTYPNKVYLSEVIDWLPLHKIMIETDCPFLTPKRFSGKENHPEFVGEVAQKIAEIKGLSIDEVKAKTTENAKRFFKLES